MVGFLPRQLTSYYFVKKIKEFLLLSTIYHKTFLMTHVMPMSHMWIRNCKSSSSEIVALFEKISITISKDRRLYRRAFIIYKLQSQLSSLDEKIHHQTILYKMDCYQQFPFIIRRVSTLHIAKQIFLNLDQNDMAKCRLVSKVWKGFMDHNTPLWGKVPTHRYIMAAKKREG